MSKKLSAMVLSGIFAAMIFCGCEKAETDTNSAALTDEITSFSEMPEISAYTEFAEVTEMTVTGPEAPEITETEISDVPVITETSEETEITKREMPFEQDLTALMSYIQHGGGAFFGMEQYDFLDDLKLDTYKYFHRGDGVYDVILTCSDSSCGIFPDGDSEWVFDKGLFFPAAKEDTIIFTEDAYGFTEPIRTAYFAACDYTVWTGCFDAKEPGERPYYAHWALHSVPVHEDGTASVDEAKEFMKKLYDIDLSDEDFAQMEDVGILKDGILYPYMCGHGRSWYYPAFAGYDETDTELKVRIDYYGDELYFYAALQSEYTFSKNEDGTITLRDVQKVFDSGYEPASGTV